MHCSPCLAASRTPRIPIQAISPYLHSLTMRPPRPARRLAQIFTPTSPANQLRRRAARRRRQRMASLRDATSASQWGPALKPVRRPAPAARIPGEPGQAGPGKSPQMRRQIRRTNDGSRRPGPASRLRCAVGVPRLYLFEYLLQRFFDSFQFVVCLFLAFNKDVKPAVYSAVKHPCEYPQHAPLALYRY